MGDSPPNYAGDTLSGTTGLSVDPADPRDTSPGGRSFTVKPSDEVLSSLKCAICMEYCLKTVTLAPCFHSFCGHCLTTWFQTGEKDFNLEDQDERRRRGKKCPICRNVPNVASRNLIIDEFVRGYLASHPEERRSDAEIEIITRQENIFLENITQLQTSRLRSEQNTHMLVICCNQIRLRETVHAVTYAAILNVVYTMLTTISRITKLRFLPLR